MWEIKSIVYFVYFFYFQINRHLFENRGIWEQYIKS